MVAAVVGKELSPEGSRKTPDAVVGAATEGVVRPAKGSEGVGRLSSPPAEASLSPAMAYQTPISMLLLAWMLVAAIARLPEVGPGPGAAPVVESIVAAAGPDR